jgi:hypothetical protein
MTISWDDFKAKFLHRFRDVEVININLHNCREPGKGKMRVLRIFSTIAAHWL